MVKKKVQLYTTDDYNITTIYDRRLQYYNYTRQTTTILQRYKTDDNNITALHDRRLQILQLYTTDD